MQRSENINEIATALANAQAELGDILSMRSGAMFTYANLPDILREIRPTFSKHGLAFVQESAFSGDSLHVSLDTLLMHGESGQWLLLSKTMPAQVHKNGVSPEQAGGAAFTYIRKYGILEVAGVGTNDAEIDDLPAGDSPDPGILATDSMLSKIRDLLAELNISEADFCKEAQISQLEKLYAARVPGAMKHLQKQIEDRDANN